MLSDAVLRFLLFWGIWALVPMMVDGLTAFGYLWLMLQRPEEEDLTRPRKGVLVRAGNAPPVFVSIIVPVYNAERSIYRCLESISAQTYPKDYIEVLCVGNAVSDRSVGMFARAQKQFADLSLIWVDLKQKGKSKALNAGAFMARGALIFNIDADTRLQPDAVMQMVRAFEANPELGAASGSIHVELLPREAPWWWKMINACEVMEYLTAFRIGRRHQTLRDAVFTLSGAFSVFRRDTVLRTHRYDDKTVSEDTKLTFDVRNLGTGASRIACIWQAAAFVEPTLSVERFNAQRLRWQRGQLEVMALYPEYYERSAVGALKNFTGRILLGDHTVALPRLTWTFMMPYLYVLGYSLPLVAMAIWVTYFLYVMIDACFLLAVREPLRDVYGIRSVAWWFLPFTMPLYRFAIYWFRLGGILYALLEPATWTTEHELLRIRREAIRIWLVMVMLGGSLSTLPQKGLKAITRAAERVRGPAPPQAHVPKEAAHRLFTYLPVEPMERTVTHAVVSAAAATTRSSRPAPKPLAAEVTKPPEQVAPRPTQRKPTTATSVVTDAPHAAVALPVYTREELEKAIADTRSAIAAVVFKDQAATSDLKERLRYLHGYKVIYDTAAASSKIDPDRTQSEAVARYERLKSQ